MTDQAPSATFSANALEFGWDVGQSTEALLTT